MATTYTSTIEVNVWKEHTCISCGTIFRYLFKRKKTGQGGTEAVAEAAARKAVVDALANEVDMQPCPGCGLYQPDMIGNVRRRRHWYLFGAVVPVVALVLILALADILAFSTAAWIGAATCGLLTLGHLMIDFNNPNSNLDANHRLAERLVEKGDLWVPGKAKGESGEDPGSGVTGGHRMAYLLLVLSVLAFVASEGLRIVRGWPVNNNWHPSVAGPGDDPYIWFDDKINSVKNYWRGQGVAHVLNAQEVGLPATLPIVTRNDNWGNTIRVKSSEKNSRSTLWVRLPIPKQDSLAGKTLKLRLDLTVDYPAANGNRFDTRQGSFSKNTTLHLASAGAGHNYRTGWWVGVTSGLVLFLLASATLARLSDGFRKKALPTDIFVPGDDAEESSAGPAEHEPPRPLEEEDHFRRGE
jgi:hypothetical protein